MYLIKLYRQYWENKLVPTEIVCYPDGYSLRITYVDGTFYNTNSAKPLGVDVLNDIVDWFEDDCGSETYTFYRESSREVFKRDSIRYMKLEKFKTTAYYWS